MEQSYLYLDSVEYLDDVKMWYENIKVQGKEIKFKLDTGAMVNVLPSKFIQDYKNLIVRNSSEYLIAYNGTKIENLGVVELLCTFKSKTQMIKFL